MNDQPFGANTDFYKSQADAEHSDLAVSPEDDEFGAYLDRLAEQGGITKAMAGVMHSPTRLGLRIANRPGLTQRAIAHKDGKMVRHWVHIDQHAERAREQAHVDIEAQRIRAHEADYADHGCESASFKRWFGDWEHDASNASKVISSEGNPAENWEVKHPRVMYHGTANGGNSEFSKDKMNPSALFGPGFYFTEDANVAKMYQEKDVTWKLNKRITPQMMKDAGDWFNSREGQECAANASFGWAVDSLREMWQISAEQLEDEFERHPHLCPRLLSALGLDMVRAGNPEIKACYLNIREPFDADAPLTADVAARLQKAIDGAGLIVGHKFARIYSQENTKPLTFWEDAVQKNATLGSVLLSIGSIGRAHKDSPDVYTQLQPYAYPKFLRSAGFDGLTHVGGNNIGVVEHRVWIAFEPTQIKSIDNRGTFDPSDPDISKAVANQKGAIHYETIAGKRVRKFGVRDATRVEKLLQAGRAEIVKQGTKWHVRVKPKGNTRFTAKGHHKTMRDAKFEVLDHFHPPTDAKAAPVRAGEKNYYDVGAKIGGARKDIANSRDAFNLKPNSKNLAALEKQDPDAAARVVNKSTLWPTPDLVALRKAKKDPMQVFATCMVQSAISPKPASLQPKDRLLYLDAVLTAKKLCETASNGQELMALLDGWNKSNRSVARWFSDQQAKEKGGYRPYAGIAEPSHAEKNMAVSTVVLGKRFNELLDGNAKFAGKTKYTIAYYAERIAKNPALAGEYWDLTDEVFGQKVRAVPTTKAAASDDRLQKWERTVPTEYERKGGSKITIRRPEDYLKRFGLRGVEFGNWMDDDASRLHVDRCAEAFQDMADVLGMAGDDVSIHKRLALAFGARGHGWAAAHYEPGKVVINLTKGNGAGTLGHEWGHFLDDVIGKQNGIGVPSDMAPSAALKSDNAAVRAVGAIMKYIKEGGDTREMFPEPGLVKKYAPDSFRHGQYDRFIERHPGDPQAAIDEMAARFWWGNYADTKYSRDAVNYICAKTGAKSLRVPVKSSQYIEESTEHGGKNSYWTRGHELFARAWETYLLDKLAEKRRFNNYLVSDIKGSKDQAMPYPRGEDRKALKLLFDDLVAAVHETKTLKKALAQPITLRKGNVVINAIVQAGKIIKATAQ